MQGRFGLCLKLTIDQAALVDLPTENIVALLAWSASHRSVFSHNNQLRFICHRQRSFVIAKTFYSLQGKKFYRVQGHIFCYFFCWTNEFFLLIFFKFFRKFFFYFSVFYPLKTTQFFCYFSFVFSWIFLNFSFTFSWKNLKLFHLFF